MFTTVHDIPIHLAPQAGAGLYRSRVVAQGQATCAPVCMWTKRKAGVATG
jgi:hypothetical protein